MKKIVLSNMKKLSAVLLTACVLGGAMSGCGFRNVEDQPTRTETNAPVNSPEETAHETDSTAETIVSVETVPETESPATEAPETEPPAVLVSSVWVPFHSVTLPVGEWVTSHVSLAPADAFDSSVIWTTSDSNVATVNENGTITALAKGECTVTVSSRSNPAVYDVIAVTVENAPACTYIDGILIANKTYALPESYALGVDGEAYDSLLTMMSAAAGEGISLWLVSGYRSYWDQYTIYNNYVARDGQAEADRYSARPGHSEHQSGLAFDLNSLYQSFGDTVEGIWLEENCHRFGFVIRYPKNKEHITGYMYEPWHVRYVGVDFASKIKESGLCVEEYFGITSVYGG